MSAAVSQSTWKPHGSLTIPPTNLKEAIDWVLRVTGKDGKENDKTASPPPPASPPQFGCLCFLAKAVKDLLYDAKDPGSPGPSPKRNWDDLLLKEESDIAQPVLSDLGLVNGGSTGAASSTCAGGTEVIGTLIDHLAQGLQKWVGWKETGDDCCLKGHSGESKGIGRECTCQGGGGGNTCCSTSGSGGTPCHECTKCGTSANAGADKKCYLSAYCKNGGTGTDYLWPTLSDKADQVHLLARIFLGSVCLIWSGLSQLGFLTEKSDRWEDGTLSKEDNGLGSFMAAMGYDLERLNGSGAGGKGGDFVWKLLSGQEPSGNNGIQWKEFASVKSKTGDSVAEYYSEIYKKAKEAGKGTSEKLCEQYPLLVLHILASGYFRAGSAGANKIPVTPPKAATSTPKTTTPETTKKDNAPRKPRTIREILYWLSALPYSEKYKALVERMGQKTEQVTIGNSEDKKGQIELYDDKSGAAVSTTLHKDKMTHYLMAACGYCPLVLIGIQGTIEREVKQSQPAAQGPGAAGTDDKRCPEHKKDPSAKRCNIDEIKKKKEEAAKVAAATAAPAAPPAQSTDGQLKEGQVCYGGYHLAVSSFGPLHGMYANGLFGFQMDMSSAQCLDQLRVYVYHCFYQLYFLRKQCKVGVVDGGAGAAKTVLGWKSCRYGFQVAKKTGGNNVTWQCTVENTVSGGTEHTKSCGLQDGSKSHNESALQGFLCDSIYGMNCQQTVGRGNIDEYPEIYDHMNKTIDKDGKEHEPHRYYPQLCPVPMGWDKDKHFKDLTTGTHKTEELHSASNAAATSSTGTGGVAATGVAGKEKYPAHCTGNTLSHLLEYYCDPIHCHGSLVVLLRLLACITPTVPRTLGDLFGFYYYIVYIGGKSGGGGEGDTVYGKLEKELRDVRMNMLSGNDAVVGALEGWKNGGDCQKGTQGTLNCLIGCTNGGNTKQCSQYLSPLSGQQYGQLSPAMAGTYLSWLVYLIEKFEEGLRSLEKAFRDIACRDDCNTGSGGAGCGDGKCQAGTHGDPCSSGSANQGVCGCTSVVSCTGVLPVLYKYGFGYGDVSKLGGGSTQKKCHDFLGTLEDVLKGDHLKNGSQKGLHREINQLIYTTRLPWIFVLTLAWLMAVLYLAFGAIWPLDWTHMRSHCRGWFRKASLSPWEVLMVGKKKGSGILEFFGRT